MDIKIGRMYQERLLELEQETLEDQERMFMDAERKRELLMSGVGMTKERIDDTETMRELFGLSDDELHPYLAQSQGAAGDLPYEATAFMPDAMADADEDLTEFKFAKFATTYFQVLFYSSTSFILGCSNINSIPRDRLPFPTQDVPSSSPS